MLTGRSEKLLLAIGASSAGLVIYVINRQYEFVHLLPGWLSLEKLENTSVNYFMRFLDVFDLLSIVRSALAACLDNVYFVRRA